MKPKYCHISDIMAGFDLKMNEVSKNIFEFKTSEMNIPGRIYASESLIKPLLNPKQMDWSAIRQLMNVSNLPGVQKYALAMSDIHPGYGFPIGGVAAMDLNEGMVVVGGVGFDINCGVRIMKTPLTVDKIIANKESLANALFDAVPAGLGRKSNLRLQKDAIEEILVKGAGYVVNELGFSSRDDLKFIEEKGVMKSAAPEKVSLKAKQRGMHQIGTLGSGNHYLEVQYVDEIYDEEAAQAYGIFKNQVVISIHCGSRGLGHQVGTDYLNIMSRALEKYNITVPDKELVGAPINSEEGQDYLGAVWAASNSAFANRQMIAHLTREAAAKALNINPEDITTLYEVGHNNAKIEKHIIDGSKKEVLVHRKGSTRAFGKGGLGLPENYSKFGQPMPVGGTMGTASFILRGTEKAMNETFGSGIHGAGRAKSRVQAKKDYTYDSLMKNLGSKGILIRGHSQSGIAEEAPGAYKDVEEVVNSVHDAGINMKVARLRPIICIKG